MKGKTVVMTGGTSGIGEIAAERLAQLGARIVLIAPDKSRGEETWRDLSPPIACIPASSPRASATKAGRNLTLRWLAKLFAILPSEKGAETIVYLASSAAVTETTGVYFYQRLPIIGYFLAVTSLCAKRKKGPAMSNHGTASSDDTIIRVDRSTPVVYPHYWWLKNVAHPEFQAKGPPEYDLATVELWLHKGQKSARKVAGNLIKGQKKDGGVTRSLIYEHLLKNNMLVSCLGFADGREIQKKGILVFRKFFNGKGLYLWNSVAEDLRDGLQVSFLAELGDEVVMGWRWLGHIWDRDDPAARFPS